MGKQKVSKIDYGTEVLDEEPRRIIFDLINQLRREVDVSRITLPTFVLEPRSMCERVFDIMTHVDLLSNTVNNSDPVQRFLDVVRYYISGWYLRPRGVKKPYNPVLGEFFRCKSTSVDNRKAIYVCEQVSHHPPCSAYFFSCPESDVWICGEVWPKSMFLGNSISMRMQGVTKLILGRGSINEEYLITLPSMYARGILFGAMYLELGDDVTIRCAKTDLIANIHFVKKGFFGNGMNEINGKIKNIKDGKEHYSFNGHWVDKVYLKKYDSKHDSKTIFLDTSTLKSSEMHVEDLENQEDNESRKKWRNVTEKILVGDMDGATKFKQEIEDLQRQDVKARNLKGIPWTSRFFNYSDGIWKFDLTNVPTDAHEAMEVLDKRIFNCETSKSFIDQSDDLENSKHSQEEDQQDEESENNLSSPTASFRSFN